MPYQDESSVRRAWRRRLLQHEESSFRVGGDGLNRDQDRLHPEKAHLDLRVLGPAAPIQKEPLQPPDLSSQRVPDPVTRALFRRLEPFDGPRASLRRPSCCLRHRFSAPPWCPRGRPLRDTLTLSVLVAFARCHCFSGFVYGLWLPVLAPQRPPMAPPMNGKSKARTPETLRIVPNPCCGAACWALCCAPWGSVMPESWSMKLTPSKPPMIASTSVTTSANSGTRRPCFRPERDAILPAAYPPIRKARSSVIRSPMRAVAPPSVNPWRPAVPKMAPIMPLTIPLRMRPAPSAASHPSTTLTQLVPLSSSSGAYPELRAERTSRSSTLWAPVLPSLSVIVVLLSR